MTKTFFKKSWLSVGALIAGSVTISTSAFAGNTLKALLYDGLTNNTYQTSSGSVRSVSQGYRTDGSFLCAIGADPSGIWKINNTDCAGIAKHRAGLMESYAWACTGLVKGLNVTSECSHQFFATRNGQGNPQNFSLVGRSTAL